MDQASRHGIQMNCQNCKWWVVEKHTLNRIGWSAGKADGGEPCGECRGHVPIPAQAKGGKFRVWPLTIASDWCSQYVGPDVRTETVSISDPAIVIKAPRRGRPPKVTE